MGDFENSGKPDPASAHVTPKTAIGGALSGRELRDVLLFLDAVYRGIGPLNLAGALASSCLQLLKCARCSCLEVWIRMQMYGSSGCFSPA